MPCCVVAGAGPGNSLACAERFASAGYRVALLARSTERLESLAASVPGAIAVPCDVGDGDSVRAAFATVRESLGPVDVLIQNAGSGIFGDFFEVEADDLERAFRTNVLGLFHCGREAVADMQPRGSGAIVVIGATASLRGGARFAAFAQAKAAQRSLAQSMARRLGREGVHVAHVVIDGAIDVPSMRQKLPEQPDSFFLAPSAIAEMVFRLAIQDPSAWTFELDLRPFAEPW